jgi:hypothetical protein
LTVTAAPNPPGHWLLTVYATLQPAAAAAGRAAMTPAAVVIIVTAVKDRVI